MRPRGRRVPGSPRLGDPLSPAVYTKATAGGAATLERNFSSGTRVVFTYNKKGDDGSGEVWWGGKPPPPPPAPPSIRCGSCGSSLLNDTTFGSHDVDKATAPSAAACCALCAGNKACAEWAWHGADDQSCHLHSAQAKQKAQRGTVSGVMNRTALES